MATVYDFINFIDKSEDKYDIYSYLDDMLNDYSLIDKMDFRKQFEEIPHQKF